MPITAEQLIAALPEAERKIAEGVYENLKDAEPKTLRGLLQEGVALIHHPLEGSPWWIDAKRTFMLEAKEALIQDRIQEALRVEQAKRVNDTYDRVRRIARLDEPDAASEE